MNVFAEQGPLDHALGAFLGLAIGDALGAPVEFCSRDTFEPVTDMRAGGYFKLPVGAWTDDTAMALCLGDSLLSDPALDPKDLLDPFCRWASAGENTSTGVCVGIGQNTLRVLGNYHRKGDLFAPPTKQKSDGNGAAMRLAPVMVRHWRNPAEACRVSSVQSRVTHYSDISAGACEYLAVILSQLIGGKSWNIALEAPVDPAWPDEVKALAHQDWAARTRGSINSSGYVVHTLEAAIWAVATTNSFSQALLTAVNLGDDADSVGAVTGQLAGALYGRSAIPAVWLTTLVQTDRIEALAKSLFDAAN